MCSRSITAVKDSLEMYRNFTVAAALIYPSFKNKKAQAKVGLHEQENEKRFWD